MVKLLKAFLICTLPLLLIVGIYTLIEGRYYESFAMLELFPEKPAATIDEIGEHDYSYGYRWIPWPSLLKAQVKLLRNTNFHKILYKNLPDELKTYIKKVYQSDEQYKYISKNFKIMPILDSNIIGFYFYDKDKEKAGEFLKAIINIYKGERERILVQKREQLEKTFKEIEKLLLDKVQEFTEKINGTKPDSVDLPSSVVTDNIKLYFASSNIIKDVLLNMKSSFDSKYMEQFFGERFLQKVRNILEETYKKYDEYVQTQMKNLSQNLRNSYINDTYVKAVEEIQNFFSQTLIGKYNGLFVASSGIGTINVSIPVTVSDKSKYPNLLINLLGAVAIGFLLALSYFVFFAEGSSIPSNS